MAERHGSRHALALLGASVATGHRARHPAFINKDQADRIDLGHLLTPRLALLLIYGCVTFRRV
jgi:hypothetical protein